MGRASALLAVLFLLVASFAAVSAGPAAAQLESGEARYEVDPATRSIKYSETVRVPFSDSLEIQVPVEATDLTSSASVRRDNLNEFVDVVTLSTSARTATLSYAVPGDGDRDEEGTRVNESFIGFHLWPSTVSDSLTVALPKGYQGNVSPTLFDESEVDQDLYEYTSDRPQDAWGYWFVAFKESGLNTREVDTGEDIIELAAWAGDDEWLDFTERYVSEGVPVLRDLIGQPWPEEGLRVVESVAPTQYGYAGWYDRRRSEIEIPDTFDSETLLHELSHAWFNDRFYQGRWMVEGFAEEYASAALLEVDGEVTEPDEPGDAPRGWRGLASWRPRFFFEDNWDHEIYGYEAAWFAMDALADEIGPDAMKATIAAMQSGQAVYPVEGAAPLHPPNDWRRFLDMLEIHGGSTGAEAVFREWVVAPNDVALLEARRSAIQDYEDFGEEIPLPVPPGIKNSMSRWRFDQVTVKMDAARDAYARMVAAEDRAQDIGLSVPVALEELYGEADADFGRLERMLDSTEQYLVVLEDDPAARTEANERNFQLGRYERIDVSSVGESSLPELNAGRDTGSGIGLFLVSFIGFLVVAVAALLLLGRLQNGVPIPEKAVPSTTPPRQTHHLPPPPGPQPPPPSPGDRSPVG
ncbi:MAG: hypothetical protein ACR2NL_12965 [Acidimicrobiia bacterium]